MAYRYDMQNKTGQQRAIVAARDTSTGIIAGSKSSSNEVTNILINEVSIFMKLGVDSTGNFDGYKTMHEYEKCISENGATWFSTSAIHSGMSKKQKEEFLTAISKNKRVYIYFVVGKSGGGRNEIEFRAEVIDLESMKNGMQTPNINITPEPWKNEVSTTWIKIKKLSKYKNFSVDDFKFISNDKKVSEILNSNCCFGYITQI